MDQDLKNDLRVIHEQISGIEVSIVRIVTTIDIHTKTDKVLSDGLGEKLLRIQTLLERHDHILFGNESLGMKTQLDRLQEKEKTRQWSVRSLWTAFLVMLGKVLYDLFFPTR